MAQGSYNVSRERIKKLTSSGRERISPDYREGTKVQFVSHDFTDKTTWWQNATFVQNETLTDSGDGLTFNFANDGIINALRISDRDTIYEDDLMDSLTDIKWKDGFIPKFHKIYVDGSHIQSGYTIDYTNGTVTFDSSQSGNTITADYYYATTSDYELKPESNKVLRIEHVEVQFDKTISDFQCTFKVFQDVDPYGVIEVHQRSYLQMDDYLNESNLSYDAEGFPAKQGSCNVRIFPWNYPASVDLKDADSMSIKIVPVDNTTELSGNVATAAFYGTEEDE